MKDTFKATIQAVEKTFIVVDNVKGSYQGTMYVRINEGKCYDFFGEEVTASYFKVGMVVEFETNGIMTLSLPPRVSATTIREWRSQSYLKVEVIDVSDAFLFKIRDEMSPYDNQLMQGNTEINYNLKEGDTCIILYDGVMTRSIPSQIHVLDVIK